jgi:hypothetical protein
VTNPGSGEISSLALADLDHNGQNELYAANQDGKIYQLKWTNPGWSSTPINIANVVCNQIAVCDGDNDGQDEIYGAGQDGHAWQFRLNGSAWQVTDVGNAGTPLNAIAVGDGDNNFQLEVYALGADGHVYQFQAATPPTPTPTPVPTASVNDFKGKIIDEKHFYVYPNPTHGVNVKFRFFLPQSADVKIKIYTTTDMFVWETGVRNYPAGWSELTWNASGMANGVYFYLGEAWNDKGRERVVKKPVLLK